MIYYGEIIARIELFPAVKDGKIPCLTNTSWIHMSFEGKHGYYSGYCTFIGVDKCYAGESADVRLRMVAFSLVEDILKEGTPFNVCKPVEPIGKGVVKQIIGRID